MMAGHPQRDDRLAFVTASVALLIVSEYLVRTRIVSPASFAAPTEIAMAFPRLFGERGFGDDIIQTSLRSLIGTVIGYPLGVFAALGMHRLGRSRCMAECLLDLIRSIPITALIPLFIAIYGVGDENKIAVGAFSSLLVTTITVWIALKHGTEGKAVLLALYRPSYWKTIRYVLLPAILPSLVAAGRLAVSSSLVLVIVAEMFIGTSSGIGKVINDMTYTDDRASQYAAVVSAGLVGFAFNAFGSFIHARLATPIAESQVREYNP
jgi:ABC-type nitrate/sulfonate/bicarbonate transport system permease component